MTTISLHGFNNLTKNLSFSLYKLHYLSESQDKHDYTSYINEHFSADILNSLLTNISSTIGGTILNVARQDYFPQGASVTLMMSEEAKPESIVAHLDKSHLCIHTYPDEAPQQDIAIFRADIELSTCGVISPLKILNYVIDEFDADVVDIDYRIRGMTRNRAGEKLFNVDSINKISDFLSTAVTNAYNINEHGLSIHNLFHAKLSKKNIKLCEHTFGIDSDDLSAEDKLSINEQLLKEIQQLFTNTK